MLLITKVAVTVATELIVVETVEKIVWMPVATVVVSVINKVDVVRVVAV